MNSACKADSASGSMCQLGAAALVSGRLACGGGEPVRGFLRFRADGEVVAKIGLLGVLFRPVSPGVALPDHCRR